MFSLVCVTARGSRKYGKKNARPPWVSTGERALCCILALPIGCGTPHAVCRRWNNPPDFRLRSCRSGSSNTAAPSLWKGNSVLVMDNMKSHHAKTVKNLLDSSGVRYIYLPPYRPDLNPIEKLWSKVKSFLRKFKARTLDALPNAIQHAFQTVSPSDCSGWFKFCDYLH